LFPTSNRRCLKDHGALGTFAALLGGFGPLPHQSGLIADLERAYADLSRPVPELVVVGRRQLHSNNSWMHNLPVLAKSQQARSGRCTALVNPADAARLGLQDGAMARIAQNRRSVEVEVEISDEMMPGVISLPHGWGHDQPGTQMSIAAAQPGANLNALLDENSRDPLSGNAVLTGIAVQMEPVARPLTRAEVASNWVTNY
jgi:anaerobic selenocysteine-containing dehydrogenase